MHCHKCPLVQIKYAESEDIKTLHNAVRITAIPAHNTVPFKDIIPHFFYFSLHRNNLATGTPKPVQLPMQNPSTRN